MSYIQNTDKGKDCVFCRAQESPDGQENLIIHRGKCTYVILNRYPYTSGHLMVVPFEHITNLDEGYITQCLKVLRTEYHSQGFNIGANIGSAAGAGIPKHFHFHVVPRWVGDTNFLSVLGETRLLPEGLEDTYHKVKNGWERLRAERKEE